MANKPRTDIDSAQELIIDLMQQINGHNNLYYNLGKPIITDEAYDRLYRQLERLEADYPELSSPDSPTQKVGSAPLADSPINRHVKMMNSLKKIHSIEELIRWHEKLLKKYGTDLILTAEPKYDGLSVEVIYRKKILQSVTLRGNNVEGQDVTDNAHNLRGLPTLLTATMAPDYLVIRGEVIWDKVSMRRYCTKSGKRYATARNAAAGLIRSNDLTIDHGLSFIPWQLVDFDAGNVTDFDKVFPKIDHQSIALLFMEEMGLSAISLPFYQGRDIKTVIEIITSHQFKIPDYETDGLVIKVSDSKLHDKIGYTGSGKYPKWSIAFKYPDEAVQTRLTDVTIQVSRLGAITPVAHFKPVTVGGVTMTKANLDNFDAITRLDLRVGDTVLVQRAGDVIPNICGVIKEKRRGSELMIAEPRVCPSCGGALIREAGQADLFCLDPTGKCPDQVKGRIKHYISREGLHIKGLGDIAIDELVKVMGITNPGQLFSLTLRELASMTSLKRSVTVASKLLTEIQSRRRPDLAHLIYALGIPSVGRGAAHILAKKFNSIMDLSMATEEILTKSGFKNEEVIENLVAFFKNPRNWTEMVEPLV